KQGNGTYTGVFNILPDRGYNAGAFFADYAARINTVPFTFTPYTGSANIGGTTIAEKVARQNQIAFARPFGGVRFTYDDPNGGANVFTTGLDPGDGFTNLLFGGGLALPYTNTFAGPRTPTGDCAATPAECPNRTVNRLPLDSEALVLK